ncbi:MAG: hypothetical protein JNL74_19300 [Fibrobacteres bacterium]|nr:hypothetical protein [Fibrobacterota bacterium]
MRKRIISIICMSIFLLSCTDKITDSITESNSIVPGRISISQADGLGKITSGSKKYSDSVHFYLGELKASRDFYFIIRNVGNTKIRNLTVTTDNSAFTVSPNSFEVLPPDSETAISTILRVSAVHGVALNGVGYTTLMKPDTNSAYITINGITTNSAGKDTVTSVTVDVDVKALFMDIVLMDGDRLVNLLSPSVYSSFTEAGIGWIRTYSISSIAKIINKGNVTILLSNAKESNVIHPDTLQPGDTTTLLEPKGWENSSYYIRLNGNNTICDYSKLHIGNDGSAYIALTATLFNIGPIDVPVPE